MKDSAGLRIKHCFQCLLLVAIISTLTLGCATTEKTQGPKTAFTPKRTWTHYTLGLGETKTHGPHLPTETDIAVTWYNGDEVLKTAVGSRAWDFNKDGSLDMIEVIGESGETTAELYDLDFDGKIDLSWPLDDSLPDGVPSSPE